MQVSRKWIFRSAQFTEISKVLEVPGTKKVLNIHTQCMISWFNSFSSTTHMPRFVSCFCNRMSQPGCLTEKRNEFLTVLGTRKYKLTESASGRGPLLPFEMVRGHPHGERVGVCWLSSPTFHVSSILYLKRYLEFNISVIFDSSFSPHFSHIYSILPPNISQKAPSLLLPPRPSPLSW